MLALVRERGYATLGHEDTAILRVAIGAREPVPIWPDDVDRVERPRLLIEGRALPLGAEGWARTYDARLIACHAAATEGVSRCPALAGRVCPLAAGADVVIVTFPAADIRSGRLLETHERLHPRPVRCVAGPGARDAPPSGVTAVGPLGPAMIEAVLRLIGRRPQLARRRPTDGEERSGRAGGPEK
jgi:hypothetical protein